MYLTSRSPLHFWFSYLHYWLNSLGSQHNIRIFYYISILRGSVLALVIWLPCSFHEKCSNSPETKRKSWGKKRPLVFKFLHHYALCVCYRFKIFLKINNFYIMLILCGEKPVHITNLPYSGI